MQKSSSRNRSTALPVVTPEPVNDWFGIRSKYKGRPFDEALAALQLLTVSDVCGLLRISKPTLWRMRRAGNFPEPTLISERIFGWRQSEIDAWLASRSQYRKY